jgi:hypothetical protein
VAQMGYSVRILYGNEPSGSIKVRKCGTIKCLAATQKALSSVVGWLAIPVHTAYQ